MLLKLLTVVMHEMAVCLEVNGGKMPTKDDFAQSVMAHVIGTGMLGTGAVLEEHCEQIALLCGAFYNFTEQVRR